MQQKNKHLPNMSPVTRSTARAISTPSLLSNTESRKLSNQTSPPSLQHINTITTMENWQYITCITFTSTYTTPYT